MKTKLILFLTLFTTLCNAQIVNIPDANFKNALINSFCVDADSNWLFESDVDLNNDGQIQASEAALVQRLDISGKNISDLTGIQSFTNLKLLHCQNNKLTTVDFSSNLKLQQLACSDNNFVSLTINGLPLLTTLFICPNNLLQNLTVTNNQSLTSLNINESYYSLSNLVNLNCSANALTSLDIYNNNKITNADCSNNRLTDIQINSTIKTLDISDNLFSIFSLSEIDIVNLDISNNKLTNLAVFNCYNLSDLNYSGNPNLSSLAINNTNITSISVHDLNNFHYLSCDYVAEYGGAKLTSLKVYNLPSLIGVSCYGNNIDTLIVADFPKLTDINYWSNPNINLTLSNLPLITELSIYTSNSITIDNLSNLTNLSLGTSCNNIHIINNALLKSIYYDQSFVNEFELKNAPALTDIFFNSGQTIPYNLNLTSLPGLTSLRLFITDSCNLNLADLPDLYQVEIHDVTHFNFHDLPKLYSITSVWGELTNFSVSNLPNLHELTFNHNKLVSLHLENLPNLYTVNVEENRITDLVLNNLPQLHDISFVYNPYGQASDTYRFSNLPKLHDLNLTSTSVGNILLNDLPGLYTISIGNDNVDTLIFSDLPTLHDVQIGCINIGSVIFNHLDSLYNLKLYSKNMQGIELNNLPNLYNLTVNYCENIAKKAINLSDLPNLYKLSLSNNNLSAFSFKNVLPKLSELDFSLNNLVSLDLSKLPELKNLDVTNNNLYLVNLDLSSNPKISTINYSEGWYHDKLKYINLRNGGNNIKSIIVGPSVKNICVDDDAEKNSLLSLNSWLAYTDFTTYCSFNPVGTFYTLQGTNLLDINNNGCNAGDIAYPMINFNVLSNNDSTTSTYFANTTGNYSIPFTAGQYTLTPQFENPAYYTFSPSSVNIDFPTQASPLIQNFCVSPNGNHNDLEITLLPSVPARPGFDATYVLVYKNKGNQVQSGNINLGFDDSVLNFVSASQTVSTQTTGLLNWTFSNLNPFESRTITITFKVNTSFVHPPVNSGSILNYNSEIIGLTDEYPDDNVSNLHQTVVNSYDPNDKTCLEGKNVATDVVGDYVHYMIRFQNTGTANATNIVVKDSIDLTKFDLSTLIPINGSHSFYTSISDINQVEFIFENINLSCISGANNGYISFKIKTKPDLVVGDSFSNKVNIYFDYNNPNETTNCVTTIQSTGITNFESKEAISTIFPNPVKDILQFKTIEKVSKVEVYDLTGRILSSNSVTGNKVNLNQLIPGTFILKAYTEKGKMSIKIIKE